MSQVIMRKEWLVAIGKAASALRFTADQWDDMTEPAISELRSIAALLTDIENAFVEAYTSKPAKGEQGDVQG